jgi:hypothetical protein
MSKRSAGPIAQGIAVDMQSTIGEARIKAQQLVTSATNHANGEGNWSGGDADKWLEAWEGPVGQALRELPDILDSLAVEVNTKLGKLVRAGGG